MTQPPGNPYGQPGPAEPDNPYASPTSPASPLVGQAGYAQPGAYPGYGPAYPNPPVYGMPGVYPQPNQYAAPQGPRYFVGVGGLRVAVIVLSALVVASHWLTAALAPAAKAAYEDAALRGVPAGQVFTAYDAAGGGVFVCTVVAWVVTCVWLQRAYQNAAAYRRYEQRRRAVWVWLGWFVPVVSLWFPKQIVDDATRTTARAAGVSRGGGTGWWWAMWLLFLVLANGPERIGVIDGAGEVVIVPELGVATALACTIAFALWVPIVNRISDIQDVLAARPVPGPMESGPRRY